jgi:predicted lipoprotein
MLPSAGDSQEAKVAQELGQFMPLTGEELAPAGRALASSAKALAPTAAEMALDIASKYGVDPRMNIIKPKGGNWANNSSEFLPRRVKKDTTIWNQDLVDKQNESLLRNGFLPELLPNLTPTQKTDLALEKWIDKKLHPYIKNEMGTEVDPIRLGIERRAAEAEKLKEANQTRLAKMESDIAKAKARGKDTTLSEGDLEKAREKFADEEVKPLNDEMDKTMKFP